MPAKSTMKAPKVGSLVWLEIFQPNPRAGSAFLIVKEGKSKKCMWAKLVGCKDKAVADLWHGDGVPERPVQFEFGADADKAADRVPGRFEYVKVCNVILNPRDKFDAKPLKVFDKDHVEEIRREYEITNSMLDEDGPAQPPPIQAFLRGSACSSTVLLVRFASFSFCIGGRWCLCLFGRGVVFVVAFRVGRCRRLFVVAAGGS